MCIVNISAYTILNHLIGMLAWCVGSISATVGREMQAGIM